MILKNIYFLCLICSSQLTSINGVHKKLENRIDNKDDTTAVTKSIVKHCFENDIVFLTHEKHDITDILKVALTKSLKLFDAKTEILDSYKRFRKNYTSEEVRDGKKNYPPSGVVIDISSDINFTKILEGMRNSIWWNSQSRFLLLNENRREDCEALNYLKLLWNFKILSALYICREKNEVVLYSFNPFKNSAPKFWREAQVINEHWTLFKLRYRQSFANPELCGTLYFDKAERLNGYRLRAQMYRDDKHRYYGNKSTDYTRCVGPSLEVICSALAHLNATVDVKKSAVAGSVDGDGNPQGPLNDIHNEKIDLMLDGYYLRSNYWKLMAYPVYFRVNYALCLATPVSFQTKLSFFFEWDFWLAVTLVCSACVFILKFVLRDSTSSAVTKFVQIALSSPSVKEPSRFYPRMLLYIVIMVTAATDSFVQIHLNWFSALPKYESTMQSVEDLAKLNLTFFGQRNIKDIVLQNTFIKKFIGFDNFSTCLDMLNNGEPVVCVASDVTLDLVSWRKNPLIYKLRDSLFDRGTSYIYVEDFPLSCKLNFVLRQMREGGLVQFFYSKFLFNSNRNRYLEGGKQMLEFDSVRLKKMLPCVYILASGWALAGVAFVTEFFIRKINLKKVDMFIYRKKK